MHTISWKTLGLILVNVTLKGLEGKSFHDPKTFGANDMIPLKSKQS